MYKRFFCVATLFAIAAQLAACSKPAEEVKQPVVVETTAQTEETEEVFPHEPMDFDGHLFYVIVDQENINTLDIEDFDITEENGEVLNDAVFRRNLEVSERFNVKFGSYHSTNITADVDKVVKAGTNDYDAFMPRLMNAATIATNGYAHELTGLKYLSLDKPWWDVNTTRDLSIGNMLYIIAGDIFYKHYDGTPMMLFNKRIITDFNLENPYELVYNNEWTIDKFNEMAKAATHDLNGDGKMDKDNDLYGLSTQADYLTSMLNGCGVKFVEKDENDFPYSAINTEKAVTVIDKILEHYANYSWCIHRDAAAASLSQFWVFPNGHSLFFWSLARFINLGLRDMEDEFGILPIPKYESKQSRYYHTLNNWHAYTYVLPITTPADEIDRTAYISDALAYYGRKYILPAYYDICLTRKYVRDNESSAMLDIIFTSTVYDLGTVFNFGTFVYHLEQLIQKNSIQLASAYAKLEKRINKDIDKIIETFIELKK